VAILGGFGVTYDFCDFPKGEEDRVWEGELKVLVLGAVAIPRVSCLGRYRTRVHSYLGVCSFLVVEGGGFPRRVPDSCGGGSSSLCFSEGCDVEGGSGC